MNLGQMLTLSFIHCLILGIVTETNSISNSSFLGTWKAILPSNLAFRWDWVTSSGRWIIHRNCMCYFWRKSMKISCVILHFSPFQLTRLRCYSHKAETTWKLTRVIEKEKKLPWRGTQAVRNSVWWKTKLHLVSCNCLFLKPNITYPNQNRHLTSLRICFFTTGTMYCLPT